MLRRPLRVHIVGAEKELVFLYLFREVSHLMGDTAEGESAAPVSLDLAFVVRSDQVPTASGKLVAMPGADSSSPSEPIVLG
jgi:hypothetical protein